jgi:hypothetical protein
LEAQEVCLNRRRRREAIYFENEVYDATLLASESEREEGKKGRREEREEGCRAKQQIGNRASI